MKSRTFDSIRQLVKEGKILWSNHTLEKTISLMIEPKLVFESIDQSEILEDYPDYWKGPCVLTLQFIKEEPVHIVWGIKKNTQEPAIIVTIYKPDPDFWIDIRNRRR